MANGNEHVADLVDDYLHALLSPGRAAEVEHHCAACPPCQGALEEARQRRAILQAVPPSEASGQLVTDTLRRISDHEQKRRRRRIRFFAGCVAALAASALFLLGAQLYYRSLKATPYDLVVLGQRHLLAATNSSLRVRLMNRAGATALAGVPVVVELRGNGRSAELARFDTDAQGVGQPRFRLPDWPDGEYGLVVTAQTPGSVETIERSIRLTRSWKLMLTSDKPVYQPGQTIHIRTLALRQPDLRPVVQQKAVFTLADPKGNIVFKHSGPTSAYGIVSTDCPLAQEITEGAYTLACKIGDTESRLRVDVQKYVLPKFQVEVRPDRAFYQPGDKAHITVQADYFFGKPVADAPLALEVRQGHPSSQVLQDFSLRTDAGGKHVVEYTIPDELVKFGDSRLSFTATVTDSAGQKQTRGIERIVTRQPVRIEVLPENGKLVQGVPNTVYLLATRADGTPVKTRLTIGGLNEVVDTDANGLASCEVTPHGAGLRWDIVARDEAEKVIARREVQLPCGPEQHDFLLRTDRGIYESGQTMRLTADGDGGEPVFVDFLKDGQTLLSESIAMSDGHGASAFDLPPDLFGTVRVCAYRLDADGVMMSKTRVVYIRPAGQLKITPKLDQQEYLPGRRAHLDLTLSDAKGNPIAGAISLAGVDEAVFAVLPQRPGTEATFYTLERPLLQPVYALYPWSPEHRTANDGRLEQALFAATARSQVQQGNGQPRDWMQDTNEFIGPSESHSLIESSLFAKVQKIRLEQSDGNDLVAKAWLVLVLAAFVLAYGALWYGLRVRGIIVLHTIGFVVVTPFLLCFVLLQIGCAKKYASPASQEASLSESADSVPLNFNVDRIEDVSVQGHADAKPLSPRVRKAFPETLLWTPQLVTDDNGHAHLDIDLADSITTWRLSASAVAADGRLGATQWPLKVFQPFFVDLNLPVSLTRNDEVSVPVVVYNYLDKAQTVTLKLQDSPWFTLRGDREQRLELAPREVRSTVYRVKAKQAGMHELQVSAFASGSADALKRTIEVVPDGRLVEQVFNGNLQQPGGATLLVPDNAIEGSVQTLVKIYPSGFSQLVEGLDNIFQMPSGCFEQTSSTTYPNILALDYLHKTQRSAPRIEAKARQYIHLGYQRLVGFEVPGGGFDWFGRPPANRTLTAYGLMEFTDMARVHDVDPELITRTRQWLLNQRKSDGSWAPEGHTPHDAPAGGGSSEQARLATTAYIAWAVFGAGQTAGDSKPTRDYLLAHSPDSINDAHILALVCHALLTLDPQGEAATPYLDRLESLKHRAEGGKHVWWQQPDGAHTTFYGSGRSGSIETTALATLALLHGKRPSGTVRGALSWLVEQKDARGTWHSTQATVLTLKALLAVADGGGDGERRIMMQLGDKHKQEIVIPGDQAEVLKQVNLSPFLATGRQRLTLIESSKTGAGYQVTFRYHVPEAKADENAEALTVSLGYDRTELHIGDTIKATAKVANRQKEKAAMVMVDLPIPAGFTVHSEDFTALVESGRIARFQVQGRNVLVYLRELSPNAPLELSYRLRATMAVKLNAPGAHVYEYYTPQRQGRSAGTLFTVATKQSVGPG